MKPCPLCKCTRVASTSCKSVCKCLNCGCTAAHDAWENTVVVNPEGEAEIMAFNAWFGEVSEKVDSLTEVKKEVMLMAWQGRAELAELEKTEAYNSGLDRVKSYLLRSDYEGDWHGRIIERMRVKVPK